MHLETNTMNEYPLRHRVLDLLPHSSAQSGALPYGKSKTVCAIGNIRHKWGWEWTYSKQGDQAKVYILNVKTSNFLLLAHRGLQPGLNTPEKSIGDVSLGTLVSPRGKHTQTTLKIHQWWSKSQRTVLCLIMAVIRINLCCKQNTSINPTFKKNPHEREQTYHETQIK